MDMIGNMLYSERVKKGIEIVDAEQATGIRAIYLQALEQGEYDVLPGKVYVKGFIRNYGNFLGLDGTKLVLLYSESIAPTGGPTTLAPAPANRKKDFLAQSPFGKKTISTMAVVMILIISVWSLYTWQKSQPAGAPGISQSNLPAKSKPGSVPASPSVNYPAGAFAPVLPAGSRPVVLVAHYSDRCWTSVIADGKTLYEGTPRTGETLTWEADRQIVVNFGNASAVELTFNGQPVGKVGERGDVVVKTFTAANASSALPTQPKPSAPPAAPSAPPEQPAPAQAAPSAPAAPPATTPVPPIAPNTPGTPGSRP